VRALVLAPFSEPQLWRLRRSIDVVYESWLETGALQDPDELGSRLAAEQVGVLVVEADFVFAEVFDAAPTLRLVAVCRNDLNHVDVESATAHGVAVTHTPARTANAVAEMTLGLMLSLARRIPAASAFVADGEWRDPTYGYRNFRGREVSGATVGIVGCGQIGQRVAAKCIALGARVIAYDPFVPDQELLVLGVEPAPLDAVAAADLVTLHLPDHDTTYHLIDASFLQHMKLDAYLINTSGGAVVDSDALVDALESGRIAGAALDVFEGQPLPRTSRLIGARNLLLTPHIGGATAETIERHSRMITDEIMRLIDGQPLRHVINPDYALAARDG